VAAALAQSCLYTEYTSNCHNCKRKGPANVACCMLAGWGAFKPAYVTVSLTFFEVGVMRPPH
jgi:hypothetical protein